MTRVHIIIGHTKRGSHTRTVAEELADAVCDDGPHQRCVTELADYGSELFSAESEAVAGLVTKVRSAELLVVASPTYKGAYTGILKSFLDWFPADSLIGVRAVPVMTGGDLRHALAPEVHLRPLLVELGATVPTRAFYLPMSEYETRAQQLASWIQDSGANMDVLVR